ncbi:unnamed protein product [Sympodiomycopsis kandeliae]
MGPRYILLDHAIKSGFTVDMLEPEGSTAEVASAFTGDSYMTARMDPKDKTKLQEPLALRTRAKRVTEAIFKRLLAPGVSLVFGSTTWHMLLDWAYMDGRTVEVLGEQGWAVKPADQRLRWWKW